MRMCMQTCVMATQRGRARTSLGLLPGHLCGGFTASPIPRNTTLQDSTSNSPLSLANSPNSLLSDGSSRSSDDILRVVLDTVKEFDHKIATIEQQQHKISESVG